MNVSQLFDVLRIIADVEIIVTLLPEVRGISNQPP